MLLTSCDGANDANDISPGGNSHIKRTGVFVVHFRCYKTVLEPLSLFSLKRFTAGVFVVPLSGIALNKHSAS